MRLYVQKRYKRKVKKVEKAAPRKTKEARFGLRMAKDNKAAFDAAATKLGLSLSSWLVLAGLEKLRRDRS